MKLGIQIAIFNRGIAMQIFRQELNDRHPGRLYSASNPQTEINLVLASTPELSESDVFLRGSETIYDWRIVTFRANDESHKREYIDRIIHTLTNWCTQESYTLIKQDLGHTIIFNITGNTGEDE